MPPKLQPKDGPADKKLLVEGADDYHFFGHFRNIHGLDNMFCVEDGGGVIPIVSGLTTRLAAENENHLGVVLDADEDVQARWESLRYRLDKAGYSNIPRHPDTDGTIITQVERPTVGIWLMPDNATKGSLEHFVSMIRQTDEPLWHRAVATVDDIPQEQRLFGNTTADVMKAKVHTWLAWQEQPGIPIDQALRKPFLNPHAPQAQTLAAWLRTLFTTGSQP